MRWTTGFFLKKNQGLFPFSETKNVLYYASESSQNKKKNKHGKFSCSFQRRAQLKNILLLSILPICAEAV
jgi:hypothetical protein